MQGYCEPRRLNSRGRGFRGLLEGRRGCRQRTGGPGGPGDGRRRRGEGSRPHCRPRGSHAAWREDAGRN
eukprot:753067-Hanusia_phi.AAC.9